MAAQWSQGSVEAVVGEGVRESLSTPASVPEFPPATPQKLKDEIADVFAQIDCFETAEER